MASNFSKKHYIQIAELVRKEIEEGFFDSYDIEYLIKNYIAMFKQDSNKFDREKFETAIYK